MAGTVTLTEQIIGSIKQIKAVWLSDGAGAADATTANIFDGVVLQAQFVPDAGGTQPDDQYNVTLKDANGFDVLGGYGANLSNAATVDTAGSALAKGLGIGTVALSRLTLAVLGAGAANGGTIYVNIS